MYETIKGNRAFRKYILTVLLLCALLITTVIYCWCLYDNNICKMEQKINTRR